MISISVCLLALAASITAHPVQNSNISTNADSCAKVLENGGATKGFTLSVTHAIHSMTVNVLKKFDPLASEHNFVPTMNMDSQSEQAILSYAPDLKSKDADMFLTDGMKTLDMVFSHMNDKNWDIPGFTTLDRVTHAFHMQEFWAHVEKEYGKIGTTIPVPNQAFCQCASDVENNGIMKTMRGISMDSLLKHIWIYENEELKIFVPAVKDKESWDVLKGKSAPIAHKFHQDVALFLYCAIQKAHQ